MSQRRQFNDVVQLNDPEDGPYLARIMTPEIGRDFDECVSMSFRVGKCTDPDCREWRTLEVIDSADEPTGEFVYHVAECDMQDRPAHNGENQ